MNRFFQDIFSLKHPATKTLVVLNTVLYIVMVANTADHSLAPQNAKTLIEWGGNYGPLTLHGEPWRLLTCTFMHSSILHLIVNMILLYCLGREMESELGTPKYLFIYFIAAIVGALVSIEFQPTLVSVGASGAIYGVFGAAFTALGVTSFEQLIATVKRRSIVLLIFAGTFIVPAFLLPGIDSSAHIGGLLTGLAVAFYMSAFTSTKFKRLGYIGLVMFMILPVIAYIAISKQYENDLRFKSQPYFVEAEALIEKKNWKAALPFLNKGLAVLPASADKKYNKERVGMLMKRARVHLELKQNDQALEDLEACELIAEPDDKPTILAAKAMTEHRLRHYQTAIDLFNQILKDKPDDAQIENDLAWSEAAIGHFEDALTHVNKSLEKNRNLTPAIDTRGTVYLLMRNEEKALADLDRAIRLNPREGAAYFHRAGIRLLRNQMDECDKDLRTAKELEYIPDSWESTYLKELAERYSSIETPAKRSELN